MKILVLSILSAIALAGCGTTGNSNATGNSVNSNAANSANASNAATATATATPASASTGSLATPTEAYKTAFALREKKDVDGLKKIMADDVKEFLSEIGKADKRSLDDMIKEIFLRPQAKTDEWRNEKIDGEYATVEYPDAQGNWKTMDFKKSGDKWLLSLPKPDKK